MRRLLASLSLVLLVLGHGFDVPAWLGVVIAVAQLILNRISNDWINFLLTLYQVICPSIIVMGILYCLAVEELRDAFAS